MLGASTKGVQYGEIDTVYVDPGFFGHGPCMLLRMDTKPGDSGAPIFDERGFLLGFHFGRAVASGLAIAIYAGVVFDALGCTS